MRKVFEWQWEELDECTWRAKVFKGWLFLTTKNGKKGGSSSSMVFVADHDHEMKFVKPAPPQEVLEG